MNELHEQATLRLRKIGQRYTRQRRTLVDALNKAPHPLSIPEIVASTKGLPQSSVYRNIAVLEQANVVHKLVARGDFAAFELAEDLGEHHHHMICTSCGRVEDFTASPQLEQAAQALNRIASRASFKVQSHRLDVVGLCKACR
ncbi:MAG: Fur family transcriptional regulator [Actinomycetota bacterium]